VAAWVFAKKSSSTTTHTALAGLQQHTYQHKNFKGRPISDPVGSCTQPNFDFFRQVHLSLTDRISKVELAAAADIDRHDEIGQLAEALSRLQKTLQGSSKMKAAA